MAETAGRRNVGAPTEVDELRAVAVHAQDVAGIGLASIEVVGRPTGGGFLDALDDLELVGLVGEDVEGLVGSDLRAHERLVLLDDLAHTGLDGGEVAVGKRRSTGQLEVVVEAILDRRSDRELGAGEQLGHRLRHHVRRRVAQHVPAVLGVVGDDRHTVAVFERSAEVDLVTIDGGRDGSLGETLADRSRDVRGGGPGRVFPVGTVGQRDCDRGVHRPRSLRSAQVVAAGRCASA